MKNTLAIIAAVALLGAGTAANAQSWSITFGSQDRYERDYRYRDHRDDREIRRWYANQRSYWSGRCYRNDVVLRDPYTGRRICVNAREYDRFVHRYGQPRRYR